MNRLVLFSTWQYFPTQNGLLVLVDGILGQNIKDTGGEAPHLKLNCVYEYVL